MTDLIATIDQCFKPFKALLFYCGNKDEFYIESYDIGKTGTPINAHPLSLRESQKLAGTLGNSKEFQGNYLNGNGIFPSKLLYLSQDNEGFAIWHTPPQQVHLFFRADLGITEGLGNVPPLLWKADRHGLSVWALNNYRRPEIDTVLFHAPFFNVYHSGSVCMGNVRKVIPNGCSIEDFIALWEKFFWGSSFSHTLMDGAIDGMGMVALWKTQMEQQTAFPLELLVESGTTLKQLLR